VTKLTKLASAVREAGSTFGVRKSEIMEAIDAGDIDHAVLSFQRQAYATVMALIPIAEAEYRKHKRDHQAYVLNAMISQGRELAADLMASSDRQNLADAIVQEVLEPMFKGMLQQFMIEFLQLKAILGDKMQPAFIATVSLELDASIKRMAKIMTDMHKTTSDQIRRKLIGD
jgi:hypothetical protein